MLLFIDSQILKCIDNLSTDPNCLENLQRADAIKYLIPNLELKDGPLVDQIHSEVCLPKLLPIILVVCDYATSCLLTVFEFAFIKNMNRSVFLSYNKLLVPKAHGISNLLHRPFISCCSVLDLLCLYFNTALVDIIEVQCSPCILYTLGSWIISSAISNPCSLHYHSFAWVQSTRHLVL